MSKYTSRETARYVLVGLVAIAAVSVGAAAITSMSDAGPDPTPEPRDEPDTVEDPILGTPTPEPTRTVSDPGPDEEPGPDDSFTFEGQCVQPLAAWYGAVVYFGAFAAILYGIKRRYSFGASFLGLYALAPPALLAYFFTTDCPDWSSPGIGDGQLVSNITGKSPGDEVVTTLPPELILGGFGLVLAATAAVLYRASGDQDVTTVETYERDDADPVSVSDLAEAAGRAADRLEEHNADADNEVYRAWWGMTSLLEVPNPDSATPGEFADAAVDVGLDEDDVARLTRLFEEVRYGERDADSREGRALEVFRTIEAEYRDRDGSETDGTLGDDASSDGQR